MTAVKYILERYCHHIHMVVGIGAARYGKTKKVEASKSVFASYRVAVGKDIADFTASDTGLEVQLYGQSLCRELLFGDSVRIFDASTNIAGLRQGADRGMPNSSRRLARYST